MANVVDEQKLGLVLDVKVQLTVRLGACELSMRDVLELSPGAVVQLDQRADESVGLYINEKLIAKGEIVVLEENFGIKIIDLAGDKK